MAIGNLFQIGRALVQLMQSRHATKPAPHNARVPLVCSTRPHSRRAHGRRWGARCAATAAVAPKPEGRPDLGPRPLATLHAEPYSASSEITPAALSAISLLPLSSLPADRRTFRQIQASLALHMHWRQYAPLGASKRRGLRRGSRLSPCLTRASLCACMCCGGETHWW